jgi:hypothetical protein
MQMIPMQVPTLWLVATLILSGLLIGCANRSAKIHAMLDNLKGYNTAILVKDFPNSGSTEGIAEVIYQSMSGFLYQKLTRVSALSEGEQSADMIFVFLVKDYQTYTNTHGEYTDYGAKVKTDVSVRNPKNGRYILFEVEGNHEQRGDRGDSEVVMRKAVEESMTHFIDQLSDTDLRDAIGLHRDLDTGGYDTQVDRVGPRIEITEPYVTRGMKITRPDKQLTIRGKAIDPSGIHEVIVNEDEANVAVNGDFWAKIRLAYGENTIIVTATDMKNNSTAEIFTIVRRGASPMTELGSGLRGKYHALIIAVKDYTEPRLELQYPISDAENLISMLTSEYTFNRKTIHFLKNPNRQTILRELETLKSQLTRNDNLLIFYSGHGYWDEDLEQGYWLPRDASADNRSEWLSNSTIRDYIRGIKTQHTLLISDACFSGGIFKARKTFVRPDASIEKIYETPSRKAITSGALKTVPDKSVFLEYLVRNLRKNQAKYLYSEKLYIDMKPAVINNSPINQTPQYGTIQGAGDEGGDFIFIRR